MRRPRLIGLTGLSAFGLIIVATFVSPPLWNAPATNAPAARVSAYAQQHNGRIVAGLLIFSLAVGLLLCFLAGLWALLREHDRPPHALSSLFAFGAVAFTVMVLAGFVPIYVLSYRAQPASVAGPLGDLGFGLLALSGIPTAVCLAAYAALVIWRRCLPIWTAWMAIGAALAHDLVAASFVSHGSFLSVEGSVIVWVPATLFAWILATSAALLRTRFEVSLSTGRPLRAGIADPAQSP
jgi:hypothetical protein